MYYVLENIIHVKVIHKFHTHVLKANMISLTRVWMTINLVSIILYWWNIAKWSFKRVAVRQTLLGLSLKVKKGIFQVKWLSRSVFNRTFKTEGWELKSHDNTLGHSYTDQWHLNKGSMRFSHSSWVLWRTYFHRYGIAQGAEYAACGNHWSGP